MWWVFFWGLKLRQDFTARASDSWETKSFSSWSKSMIDAHDRPVLLFQTGTPSRARPIAYSSLCPQRLSCLTYSMYIINYFEKIVPKFFFGQVLENKCLRFVCMGCIKDVLAGKTCKGVGEQDREGWEGNRGCNLRVPWEKDAAWSHRRTWECKLCRIGTLIQGKGTGLPCSCSRKSPGSLVLHTCG